MDYKAKAAATLIVAKLGSSEAPGDNQNQLPLITDKIPYKKYDK
jgi:hypothetical protein